MPFPAEFGDRRERALVDQGVNQKPLQNYEKILFQHRKHESCLYVDRYVRYYKGTDPNDYRKGNR